MASLTQGEGFRVTISSGTAEIGTPSAYGVLGANTSPSSGSGTATTPSFQIATSDIQKSVSVSGITNYSVTLNRIGNVAGLDTLTWRIDTDGTANPADPLLFAQNSGSLSFMPGSTTTTVTVPVNGAYVTAPEQFHIDIYDSTGALVLRPEAVIGQNYPQSGTIPAGSGSSMGPGTGGTQPSQSDAILISPTTAAVARFFDTQTGTHFFSASASEVATVDANLSNVVYEGEGFGAVAPNTALADPNGVSVYRFFDTKYGTHFYTESGTERDAIAQTRPDLVYEGVAFYEHNSPQSGDVTVLRYFDQSNGTHLYTDSQSEMTQIAATRPDLQLEGVAFYAPRLS